MTPTASVLVCRGCCCGTDDPGPAAERLATLRSAIDDLPGGRVTVTNCLGPCSHRDVVAVRHRDTERRGGRLGTTWFRRVGADAAAAIAGWVRAGAAGPVPADLAVHLFEPGATGSPAVTPDHDITAVDPPPPLAARRVADPEVRPLLLALLRDPAVAWSLGVDGASADVLLTGPGRSVTEDGDVLGAADATAGIELDLGTAPGVWVLGDDDGSPLSVVVATAVEPPAARGLTEVADVRARPGQASFDLGVPGTGFAVTTDDPVLVGRLRSHRGRAPAAVLSEVGPHLSAVSPERVVTSAAARACIGGAMPLPGGQPAEGSRTTLAGDRLARSRPLPEQHSLPAGWWVAAVARSTTAEPASG